MTVSPMISVPVTRFAPSPTGLLHLGHAYSALVASRLGDGYILRIDDIDHTRCRPEFTEQIYRDLEFLDLPWRGEPVFQSHRLAAYEDALASLRARDLVYPCYLTRAELAEVLSAPQEAPVATDRAISTAEAGRRSDQGMAPAWRLRTGPALDLVGDLTWRDLRTGREQPVDMTAHGDVVLARRDIGTSYHLSVVVDDSLDGVNLVTRGADLAQSTHVHRLLQALLDLPSPAYLHHDLVRDAAGSRLAKRHDAQSIKQLRAEGMSADDIVADLPPVAVSLPFSGNF
ncbi:MAG: tRNA glutamyl-Q(34) synthetase GluQRS [Candidatus Puniceispirillaceae bacterium]